MSGDKRFAKNPMCQMFTNVSNVYKCVKSVKCFLKELNVYKKISNTTNVYKKSQIQ